MAVDATSSSQEALLRALKEAVGTFIATGGDRDRLVQGVADQVAALLDVSCVTYLLSEDGQSWSQEARAGAGSLAIESNTGLGPLGCSDPAVQAALQSGLPYHFPSAGPEQLAHSVLLPLRSGKHSWGVLHLKRAQPGAPLLDDASVLLAQHLVQVATMSLDHASALADAGRQLGDRQRLEDRLELESQRAREADRLKGEFLVNMSHELRTPLNAIIGFSSLLHAGRVGKLSDIQVEYLGDVLVSSRHLLQLINDVLDLAKVDAGRVEPQLEPVNLVRLASEVRDILRGLAAEKHVHVAFDVAVELAEVSADPRLLKQVLYNYLSNAIKFTPSHGQVHVRIEPTSEASFKIEVEDSGVGIRPEDLDRLFIEFQRLAAGAAKDYSGTGLGLALTKRIVEAQGGTVSVVSTVGKGSIFSAELPRAPTSRGENTNHDG